MIPPVVNSILLVNNGSETDSVAKEPTDKKPVILVSSIAELVMFCVFVSSADKSTVPPANEFTKGIITSYVWAGVNFEVAYAITRGWFAVGFIKSE